MKKLFLFILLVSSVNVFAQKMPMASPPASLDTVLGGGKVVVHYHSPSVKNRDVWAIDGEIAPYGKLWRTGANNATTIAFDKDVVVNGKKLAKGKYALFTIPDANIWTIIFNKKAKQWGAYSYSEAQDALRITAKPNNNADFSEKFQFKTKGNNTLILHWAKVEVPITIE